MPATTRPYRHIRAVGWEKAWGRQGLRRVQVRRIARWFAGVDRWMHWCIVTRRIESAALNGITADELVASVAEYQTYALFRVAILDDGRWMYAYASSAE